jgi:diguanylate cyclase (GGDEF)-like protein/PAS domain S-box-containing protein
MATPKRTLDPRVRRSKPNSGVHPELRCSYDLRGRLIEINEAFEQVLGYSRQEILGANLREFLDPTSWETLLQGILQQTGGAAPEPQNIQIRGKNGELSMLEIASRLVFDKGSPVAVGAAARDLTPPEVRALNHRLGSASYRNMAEVFADFLKTGCAVFDLDSGAVFLRDGEYAVAAAVHGTSPVRPGLRISLRQLDGNNPVADYLHDGIQTPVLVGGERFGFLGFFSNSGRNRRVFSDRDREIVELMSRSLGRFIAGRSLAELGVSAERSLTKTPAEHGESILERGSGMRQLTATLAEVGRLLENHRQGWKCFFQLAEHDGQYLDSGAKTRSVMEFAARSGLVFAESHPILSGDGNTVGTVALLRPDPPMGNQPDRDMVAMIVRMAGIAIEQKHLADRFTHQARHDPLTGLPNRGRLLQFLETAVTGARTSSEMVAVLFIDLDRFKQINDTLGHAAGDRILVAVAERLRSSLSAGDIVARMGGDEFAAVLADPGSEAAVVATASRLLEILRAPYAIDGRELFVTASIGIGLFPIHGDNSWALLRAADAAMHSAKVKGRNCSECFVADNHGGGIERLDLENGLRRALERSEFELNFQAIVSINGDLEGFEALLGWNHPSLGRVPPLRFIPIAEETGLIIPIGQWVLEQACSYGARWIGAGLPFKVMSVNVSAVQFGRPNFVETVAAALEFTGFPAHLLELELTEGVVMRDIDESIRRMGQLRAIGVSMTIDDFGTGYSSLNYLRRLPVGGLKIDQSFLRDLQSPSSTMAVVETIVALAHNMKMSVVAEGVETERELELMRAAGCDRVQGHLYGRAVSAAAAEALLARPEGLVRSPG